MESCHLSHCEAARQAIDEQSVDRLPSVPLFTLQADLWPRRAGARLPVSGRQLIAH